MEKLEIFPWAKNFETGIEVIDEQHKKLVDILNTLAGHLANCSLPTEMNTVFDELAAYANYHFKSEEEIWSTHFQNDAWYLNYLKTHKTFFSNVVNLKKEEGEKSLDRVIQDIVSFLSKWLAYHILDTDKRMAKTVQAIQSGKSLEDAKVIANEEMSGSMRVLIDTVLNMYEGISVRTVELMREKALRIRAEQALAASEERWNFVLKYILGDDEDNVWDWDIEKNVQYLSGIDLPVFHMVDNSDVNFKKESAIHPEDFERVKADLQAHLNSETDFFINKHRVSREGGRWAWVLSRGKVVSRDEHGKALRMVGTQTDITERELAGIIYKNSSQAMYVTDGSNKMIGFNKAFTTIMGYAPDEVIGQTPDYFSSNSHDEQFFTEIEDSIHIFGHWEGEIWNRRKNGEVFPAWQTINAVVDSEGEVNHSISLFSDISEIKEVIAERERLQQDLQQAQKMESLGQLTGGIAHDFNNLLGIISGYSGLVLAGCEQLGEKKLVGYMGYVEEANKRAANLISQMMTFSRSDRADDIPIQFATVIKHDIKMLRATLPSSIEIYCECEAGLPRVLMNPTQLNQILMNLTVNARDAMKGVGQLRITCRWARGLNAESPVSHKMVQGDWIELSVSDTGSGIEADMVQKIFNPYFTTKGVGKGTGLGLAVIYGIMEKHEGHILLETDVGMGSTFRLLFAPIQEEQVQKSASLNVKDPGKFPQGDGSEVLVVDDEKGFGTFIEALLHTQGYQAMTFTDGLQAFELFAQNPLRFSLLITDQTMPQITGIQLVKKIRELRPEIPAIVCTGYSGEQDAEDRVDPDICFFPKPLDETRFLSTVAELLQSLQSGNLVN